MVLQLRTYHGGNQKRRARSAGLLPVHCNCNYIAITQVERAELFGETRRGQTRGSRGHVGFLDLYSSWKSKVSALEAQRYSVLVLLLHILDTFPLIGVVRYMSSNLYSTRFISGRPNYVIWSILSLLRTPLVHDS
jgi:hypothetical protein